MWAGGEKLESAVGVLHKPFTQSSTYNPIGKPTGGQVQGTPQDRAFLKEDKTRGQLLYKKAARSESPC